MTPEEAVIERLLDITAVVALVSQRVYHVRLPQSPRLPAIRVQLISEPTDYHLRGGSGMYFSRIQVDAYAVESSGHNPYEEATDLGDAIHGGDDGSGLSGWQGLAGGSPAELRIHTVQRVDRQVGYDAGELREVRCRQDYVVHWSRMQ